MFLAKKRLKYTVQHTCSNEGGKEHVLENAPFHSKHVPSEGKKPFLGAGFYYWEYNYDYAKFWGIRHYQNRYFVLESVIEIEHETDGIYLDLAGSRRDLVWFVELLIEFNLIHEEGTKGIDLCYIIDYLRHNSPEAFPFKVIRAVDYKNDDKRGIKIDFNGKEKSYTILNPRMLISFLEKSDIVYIVKPFIRFAS